MWYGPIMTSDKHILANFFARHSLSLLYITQRRVKYFGLLIDAPDGSSVYFQRADGRYNMWGVEHVKSLIYLHPYYLRQ